MEKVIKSFLCHEWGHALMTFILLGDDSVDTIIIEDTFERIDGHTVIDFIKRQHLTNEQELLIYVSGVVAENICGYSKVKMHRGTDETFIKKFLPKKQERIALFDEAFKILSPYKETLEKLTDDSFSNYPKERIDGCIYYRIFRDEICALLKKHIK